MNIQINAICKNNPDESEKIVAVATIDGYAVVMFHNKYFGYFIYDQDKTISEESIRAFADKVLPPTHCQHEHDCCGNWYLHFNKIEWNENEPEGDMWKIMPQYFQNI